MDLEKIKEHLQGFCRKDEIQNALPCVEIVSKTLVPLGHPVDEILKAVEGEPCEVIVLGAHGKGFWAHTSLGSKDRSAL